MRIDLTGAVAPFESGSGPSAAGRVASESLAGRQAAPEDTASLSSRRRWKRFARPLPPTRTPLIRISLPMPSSAVKRSKQKNWYGQRGRARKRIW